MGQLESKVTDAANCGKRSVCVFSAPKVGEGYMKYYVADDWERIGSSGTESTPYIGRVPDYGQFVYDECERIGLRPYWIGRYLGSNGSDISLYVDLF